MTPRVGDVVSIDGGTERWLVTGVYEDEGTVKVQNVEDPQDCRTVVADWLTFLYCGEPYYRSDELLADLYRRQDTFAAVGYDTPGPYADHYARNLRHLSAVALAFAERVEQESTDRRQDEVDRVAS